jgi:protocatechuate 3,4-dioxygenase beta subunit
VKPDDEWTCDAGFAGSKSQRGHRFRLWAAIVTEEQGYAALKTKLGLGVPQRAYATITEVPHVEVEGAQTATSLEVARPS